MSEVKYGAKDADRLKAMANAIKQKPDAASEFLHYAYGLGYCSGREVTAKEFLTVIDERQPHSRSE